MSKGFPTWARDYLAWWKIELDLQAWEITPVLSSHPAGSENNNGACMAFPDILTATITLNSDVTAEPSAAWERTIINEVLHVFHSWVDDTVQNIISPELGNGAERIADKSYKAAMEPFIQNLAYVLWRLKTEGNGEGAG